MTSLLVLGGARSGKSRYAQMRAESFGSPRIYIATAEPFDAEMAERIRRHRDDRGPAWRTIETPLDLADAVIARRGERAVLLIDCLTLWASNLIHADRDAEQATHHLCAALSDHDGSVVLVANEVGLGIVPDNALARRFRDVAGRMNQTVAASVDEVVFVAAGLPLRLK
ncbi:bifunctional adenosylcobinamide kinase/adenosylcobinamide-phosphate guanylyltransferase [Sphingomonas profundi]|uniref:bifunctional adenosylcobinamide kinase/adenosylcobinamide-phosphate guanylyltransferase n=1 Tax=Alterirhizorhabdus profundi TaxID=2681549 RepID=UPI0012E87C8C|nr:bifunctional adenosylcobinamide kinase/adenosylcobinamide-phosphate guanylyltransferase [Sphingomonas profundi]